MKTGKLKTTLYLDKGVVAAAKVQAMKENISLTDLAEKAIRNYLPLTIGVDLRPQAGTFISGPTIAQMQPDQRGLGVPTFEESLNKEPVKDNRGVPPLK